MTKDRPSGQLQTTVGSLAELELSDQTLDSILGHIARLGVEVLDGWEGAGTLVADRGRVSTFGSTDERVDAIDQYQYDSQTGPCVDALEGGVQYFDGLSNQPRYRQFAEVAAGVGIHSVISFPMSFKGEVIGALNFCSPKTDALSAGQREEGQVFAAQAAVALTNTQKFLSHESQIEQLQEGLQTRTMIGQATGLLMAQEGLSSEEAFQKLVQISQTSNIKLREIAQRFVNVWEEKTNASEG